MNKKAWIAVYFVVLAVDLLAIFSGNETTRYVSKSLLMPVLIGFFIFSTRGFSSPLKKWIILALIFSWAGDAMLMFEQYDEMFFIAGLVAFLCAHIWYIVFFNWITRFHGIRLKLLVSLIGILYYFLFMNVLKPSSLGSLEWPVRTYGAVLLIMLIAALHMAYIRRPTSASLAITGASLFVISDSLLAISKFYKQFEYAGLVVMITYGLAQLLITRSAVRYISSLSTHKFAE